jgi:hypothetical protein
VERLPKAAYHLAAWDYASPWTVRAFAEVPPGHRTDKAYDAGDGLVPAGRTAYHLCGALSAEGVRWAIVAHYFDDFAPRRDTEHVVARFERSAEALPLRLYLQGQDPHGWGWAPMITERLRRHLQSALHRFAIGLSRSLPRRGS